MRENNSIIYIYCFQALGLSPVQGLPMKRELSEFQIAWQNQLDLLHWTAQQQQEFIKHAMEEVEE